MTGNLALEVEYSREILLSSSSSGSVNSDLAASNNLGSISYILRVRLRENNDECSHLNSRSLQLLKFHIIDRCILTHIYSTVIGMLKCR
jgi:hypothetical protein